MQRLQGVLLLALGVILGAFGGLVASHWLRPAAPSAQPDDVPPSVAELAPSADDGDARARVRALLGALPAAQRQALLDDAERFAAFVGEQLTSDAIVAAARASGLADNATVRLLMRRAADRALVQTWLAGLERRNRPEGFPDAEQVARYYEDHRAEFTLPERAQVWQVFLAWPAGADTAARKALIERARGLAVAIRKGERSFEAVAADASQHVPSRYQGGYMGVVALDRLLPEVRQVVRTLEAGAVSDPVVTDAGVHVVRRGALLPATPIPLEAVRARVSERLLAAFRQRVREQASASAVERYGPLPDAAAIERWRLAWREERPGSPDGAAGQK